MSVHHQLKVAVSKAVSDTWMRMAAFETPVRLKNWGNGGIQDTHAAVHHLSPAGCLIGS